MNKYIEERVLSECAYILETKKTVREIADNFGVSKSTVHKDLSERLIEIDKIKHKSVNKILRHHMNIRHIRGGEATKQKFLTKKLIKKG